MAATVDASFGRCLHDANGRAIFRASDALIDVASLPSADRAAEACARLQSLKTRASLGGDLFLRPIEVCQRETRVIVRYPSEDGELLPTYLQQYFGDYMADENFALDLLYHVVHGMLAGQLAVPFTLRDIWLTDRGGVRLLLAGGEVSDRDALRSAGEALYGMLTREKVEAAAPLPGSPASSRPTRLGAGSGLERLSFSRGVNGEISESAENVIRRCVQDVSSGGFISLASLRQSLRELLRSRGLEPHGDRIRDFRRLKPSVEYAQAMRTAVEAEGSHLADLRSRRVATGFERLLRQIFPDPEKYGLRPLWAPLIVGLLAIVTPFLMARLYVSAVIAAWLYLGVFAALYGSYRRPPP